MSKPGPCPEPEPPHASPVSFLFTRFTPRAVGVCLGGGGSSRSTRLTFAVEPVTVCPEHR
jgi:hypothetical protein